MLRDRKTPREQDGVLRVMFTGPPDILGRRASQAPPPRAWKVTRAPDPARARPDFRPSKTLHIYSLDFAGQPAESTTEEAPPRPQMSKLQEMLVLRKTALGGARDFLTSEDLERLQRFTEVVKRLGHFARNSYFENLLQVQERQEESRQKRGQVAAPQSIQRRFGIRCRFVALVARCVTFQESTSARADSQQSERGMQGGGKDTRRKEDERDKRDRLEAVREAAEKRQEEGRSEEQEQRREPKERRRQDFEMAEAEAARESERLFEERAKRKYDMQRQAQERRTTEPERAEERRKGERTKEEEAAKERESAVRERERQRQEGEVRRREEKFREMMIEREARLAARAQEKQQRMAEEALRKQHEERRTEQEAVRERERERERHNTLSLQRSQEEAKRRQHAKEEATQLEQERMRELEAVRERGRQRGEDEPKRQTRKEEECETVPVALVGRGLDGRRGRQLESESCRLRVHTTSGSPGRTTSASSPERHEARLAARPRHEKGICDVCKFPVTSYQDRTKNWRGAYVHISCLKPQASGALHLFRAPRGMGGEIESLVISTRSNLKVSNHTSSMNPVDEQPHFIDDDAFSLFFQKQIGLHQFPPPHMNDQPTGREWSLPPGLGGDQGQVNSQDSAGRGQQQEWFNEHDYRLNEHDNRLHNVTMCGVTASSLHSTWDWLSGQSVPGVLPPPGTHARASEDMTIGTRWLF